MKILILAMVLAVPSVYAQHNHSQHTEVKQKRNVVNAEAKAEAGQVLKKNDELFNAFLKKDNALAEKIATELKTLVSKTKSSVLSEARAQSDKLSAINKSASSDDNLSAYEAFLNPLIKVVRQNDLGSDYNVFFCPMVKKSWIQNVKTNKDVRNVFAMEMLECGSQETNF